MTKQELIKLLVELEGGCSENGHIAADEYLIQYINDKEIEEAYDNVVI